MLRHAVATVSVLAFCACFFLHVAAAHGAHVHDTSPLASVAQVQDHARSMTNVTDIGASFVALLVLALSLAGVFFGRLLIVPSASVIVWLYREKISDSGVRRWCALHTTSPPCALAFS